MRPFAKLRASALASPLVRVTVFFMKPFRGLGVGILVVTLATAVLECVTLAAFLPLLQSLLQPGGAPAFGKLQRVLMVMRGWVPVRDSILASALLIVVIMCSKSACTFLREWLIARTSGRVFYAVKRRLMDRYSCSSYPFFLDAKQGTLMYTVVVAPARIAMLMMRLPQFAAELLKVAAILILLCALWPKAAVGLVLIVLTYNRLTHAFARRVSYLSGKAKAEADAEQANVSSELFTGIRHLKIFRTMEHWLVRFERANLRSMELYITDMTWLGFLQNITELAAILLLVGFVLLVRLSGPQALQANLPILGVFILALLRLLPSATHIGRVRMEMLGNLPDAEHIYDALTQPLVCVREGARIFQGLRRAIAFEDVSFAHRGRTQLLSHLNLTIEQGKITAIVGPSGAGKSTIVNLLLGLFEPSSGGILVDGIPLQDYTLDSWLGTIGFVSQDPFIYHATVTDNILFGRTGCTREDVVRAATIANAHGFISELPEGYDTMVGERGMKLSGGQQQRLAIARAMLGNPEILIFDEATSHLDTIAEQQVQDAIDQISKDHTVLLVAHRLSTVRHADKIVVLDEGRVLEEGSHEALLSEQGRYFHLVTSGTR